MKKNRLLCGQTFEKSWRLFKSNSFSCATISALPYLADSLRIICVKYEYYTPNHLQLFVCKNISTRGLANKLCFLSILLKNVLFFLMYSKNILLSSRYKFYLNPINSFVSYVCIVRESLDFFNLRQL